jgi:predicted nucleotidyltransferase
LFGSYSRNTAIRGKSDIDIMVDFSHPIGIRFVDLADELEEILHHKVDLVSRKGIKPQYFKAIEPYLIYVT